MGAGWVISMIPYFKQMSKNVSETVHHLRYCAEHDISVLHAGHADDLRPVRLPGVHVHAFQRAYFSLLKTRTDPETQKTARQ